MSTTYHTLTNAQREEMRAQVIVAQMDASEAGLEMILDGSHLAELHLLNALSIVTDDGQALVLLRSIMRMRHVRLVMWGTLGSLNSHAARG